jgi:NTP pyrophosphatase (non-canonical NTP hydrolase)
MIDLDNLAFALHDNAVNKGFWEPNTPENRTIFYLKQLAMIHSEVSETLEAIRKEKGEEQVVEELADILIRVLDLYGGMVEDEYTILSLEGILLDKAQVNQDRPRMHGVLA